MQRLKLFLAGFMTVGALSLSGGTASAAFNFFGDPCTDNPKATVCQENKTGQTTSNNALYGPNGIITKIANLLAVIVGIAAVVVIIIAGIQYMLSRGDPTKIVNAKNAILYAIAGLIVALLARTIVVFVVSKL